MMNPPNPSPVKAARPRAPLRKRKNRFRANQVASAQNGTLTTGKHADARAKRFASVEEGIATLALDGTIVYANRSLEEMVHRPVKKLIGCSFETLLARAARADFRNLLNTASKGSSRGEMELRFSDGAFVELSLTAVRMGLKGAEALSLVARDSMGRKRAQEALARAYQELEIRLRERTAELTSAHLKLKLETAAHRNAQSALRQAKETLSRANQDLEGKIKERTARLQETIVELESFSHSVAHDMRSPLRAMRGFAKLLEAECGDRLGGQATDFLQRIAASAHRLDCLIQDVLNYSKIVRAELFLEPVNLNQLVARIIESYLAFQPPRAEISVDGRLPLVIGNVAALTQVISNLLDNAVKFVKPEVRPKVRIWAEAVPNSRNDTSAGMVRVWFEDNGLGIAKENHERIFQIFQRLHRSEEFEGTGIGLAVVRKAIERMGGSVGVCSMPEQGSKFWVQLPRPSRYRSTTSGPMHRSRSSEE
jgi:PAS domain S-box-containing protein